MLIAMTGACALVLSSAHAAPKVQWTPSAIVESVALGAKEEISIEISFDTSASDVVLRVVPALTDYVRVEPSVIGNVEPGDIRTVRLTLSVDEEVVEEFVEGVVQARAGRRNLARPLPVTINIVAPPEGPGTEDDDGDGVWDDVQAWIETNYVDEPALRAAQRQFAQALFEAVGSADGETQDVLEGARAIRRAVQCLYTLGGEDGEGTEDDQDELMVQVLGVEARFDGYTLFEERISDGQVFRGTKLTELDASCAN